MGLGKEMHWRAWAAAVLRAEKERENEKGGGRQWFHSGKKTEKTTTHWI
jgi:hypothetical protein